MKFKIPRKKKKKFKEFMKTVSGVTLSPINPNIGVREVIEDLYRIHRRWHCRKIIAVSY